MGYFPLAIAAWCAALAIKGAIGVRREGDAWRVVLFAGLTFTMLSVSLNVTPLLRDLLPADARIYGGIALVAVGFVLVLGASFARLSRLNAQSRRTARD